MSSDLQPPTSISILGVRVHDVTMAETLAWIEAAVAARAPHQVCTANPEFIVAAQSDAEFRDLLNRADLVIPDGIGLLWAARWRGQRFRERVAGSDLIYRLCERAARRGWQVYFLGAAEGVAERAADRLQALSPGLLVTGAFSGSPRLEENDAIVARVQAAQPDVLMVAYGAPAQDQWIARNLHQLNVPVSLGVGGAFDFVAGVAQRAPVWMQRIGLEWLHRLYRQPWRARRIFNAALVFPWLVMFHGRRSQT